MSVLGTGSRWTLSSVLDYFIPKPMLADAEQHRRARMFMLSHAFGPLLSSSLPIYMYVVNIARDYRVAVFLVSILAFWVYPPLLRATGRYKVIAIASIQNVAFCVIWACWSFGGLLAPFLPWMLLLPLLAFLYLPPIGHVRNVLLLQIFGSLAILIKLTLDSPDLPDIRLEDMQVIGMISMASVALYFGVMSLYFAKMFREQREFSRELNALVSSSDNLRNLTTAAQQAGAAKAGFIAGMSHELRTPLNAIIGYSQLLLEEAEDEGDDESTADLGQIHRSGSDLLYLIDHILDYSRIEAGKMPVNPALGTFATMFPSLQADIRVTAPDLELHLIAGGREKDAALIDWDAIGAIIRNIAASLVAKDRAGRLDIAVVTADGDFAMQLMQYDSQGRPLPLKLDVDLFSDESDISPTKYGSTAIELALAQKYIEMLGGTSRHDAATDGTCTTVIAIPPPSAQREPAFAAAA